MTAGIAIVIPSQEKFRSNLFLLKRQRMRGNWILTFGNSANCAYGFESLTRKTCWDQDSRESKQKTASSRQSTVKSKQQTANSRRFYSQLYR